MLSFFKHFKKDFPSSIVVFLVAVPLCLGIALASGAPLMGGIIAGIIGGLIVTLFSGSALGVSGPAAGLAVIVFSSIEELGSYEIFLLSVMLAGAIQLILGLVKAGIVAYYFPSTVIKGMLAAIGIIIFLKQIPHAVGYDADYEGDLAFSQPDGHNTFSELFYMFNALSPTAIIISFTGLAILILWETKWIKKISFLSSIPAPLLVVVLGIVINQFSSAIGFFPLIQEHLVQIPVAQSFDDVKGLLEFPTFSAITNPAVWRIAVIIAIVASLETLLSLEATDKLDSKKRISPTNRELRAQGIGNLVSGAIGGLPMTQVIVRSSANIQSGGESRASSFMHGLWLLLFVVFLPNVLNLIPLASLAAILLVVGYKLAKPSLFKEMRNRGMESFIPFVVTVVAIVFTDLLTGIIIGMLVAAFRILYNNYQKPYFIEYDKTEGGSSDTIVIKLAEDVTFLHKARIMHTLKDLPSKTKVIIDASKSMNIDNDVLDIIIDYSESEENDHPVTLRGFHIAKDHTRLSNTEKLDLKTESK